MNTQSLSEIASSVEAKPKIPALQVFDVDRAVSYLNHLVNKNYGPIVKADFVQKRTWPNLGLITGRTPTMKGYFPLQREEGSGILDLILPSDEMVEIGRIYVTKGDLRDNAMGDSHFEDLELVLYQPLELKLGKVLPKGTKRLSASVNSKGQMVVAPSFCPYVDRLSALDSHRFANKENETFYRDRKRCSLPALHMAYSAPKVEVIPDLVHSAK
jgi:hypothetical protein